MVAQTSPEDDKYLVPALDRGLRILALFNAAHPAWAPGDIARALGISRSSVFRLLYTLEAAGFIERAGEKSVRLGPKILSLGFHFMAGQDLVDLARPILDALRDETGASAHLGVLDQTEVLYLARAASRQALISNLGVGARLPVFATTMGRALLCERPAEDIAALHATARAAGMAGAEILPDALAAMLNQDRRCGVVVAASRYEHGMVSVAAPLRDAGGGIVAAINISAPEQLLSLEDAQGRGVGAVLAAAQRISRALGHDPDSEAANFR